MYNVLSLLVLLHEQSINSQYLFFFDDLCCDILFQVKNKYSNEEIANTPTLFSVQINFYPEELFQLFIHQRTDRSFIYYLIYYLFIICTLKSVGIFGLFYD